MITKGIVEEILTDYSIKVRLPILDSIEGTRDATSTSDLSEAIICTTPNSEINFTVGDIVVVGFEDNDDSKPIILGFLSKESGNTSSISNNLSKLNVNVSAKLPKDTSIGNISSQDISMLQGAKFNIQSQLNNTNEAIDNTNTSVDKLEKTIDSLSKSIGTVETDISKLMPKAGGKFTGPVEFNNLDGQSINFTNSIYINKVGGQTAFGSDDVTTYVGTNSTSINMRGATTRPQYNNNPLSLLSDLDNMWNYVGTFKLTSSTEFWNCSYTFDFDNYDYRLEGWLRTSSASNDRSVFALLDSTNNWISFNMRWIQIRGTSTTTSGASLNADGYAVVEGNNYIWLCDDAGKADRNYFITIDLLYYPYDNNLYFRTSSSCTYSGKLRYFQGQGYVYDIDVNTIKGLAFYNWYGNGTIMKIYRRKKLWE